MLPPFYYKNVSDEGLFAGYSEVIQRVGDAALKIYLYHFPALSGVPITLSLIERLLSAYPNTVVGVKDSAGDFENMKAMATQFPGFQVFAGSERLLLDCLEIGGAGTISATVNVTSLQASQVFAAWKNGDDEAAKKHQDRLTNSRLAIEDYPLVPALKAIIAQHTGNDGWLTLRPPLVALPGAKRTALFDAIERIDLDLAEAA
jgi:4-hydroxy-tetrahydrodipicolinate synthase